MLKRRDILRVAGVTLLLGGAVIGGPVDAQDAGQSNVPRLALKGYDPVAYFTEGHPVQGKPDYEFIWDEARYRFASDEHMAKFRGDPDRYAPQYAGSCTGAIALGLKIEANPANWLISDGRLFVFAGGAPASLPADRVASADRNWQLLRNAPFGTDLRQ